MTYNKIFGIGLNRTGTRSLTRAFEILGLKAVHFKPFKHLVKFHNGSVCPDKMREDILRHEEFFEMDAFKNDAFSDIPICYLYKELDEKFPNSKFILTTRDVESWIQSRIRNFTNRNKRVGKDDAVKIEPEVWKEEYRNHNNNVLKYFEHRSNDLLIMDITKGDGWNKLCPFLDIEIPFPKKGAKWQEKESQCITRVKKFIKIKNIGIKIVISRANPNRA